MNEKQNRIWIFGATGFIGQALFSHLSANSHNLLFVLFHSSMPFRNYEASNIFTGSLSDFDPAIIKRYPPNIVFHLARFSGRNLLSRVLASRKAFKANMRLIEILSGLEKPPVIIYVSGSLMYGPQEEDVTAKEQSPLNPVSFARQYRIGELPWLRAQAEGELDIRFARPGWIVGPSSWFSEFFWKFFLKTGNVPYYGNGSQLMSIVGLNDCARLIDRLAGEGARCQNLNIFTFAPMQQKQFAEALAGKLNAGVQEVPIHQITHNYGKTVASALTSSIPLSTNYPGIYRYFRPQSPNLDSIFENVLPHLKNK